MLTWSLLGIMPETNLDDPNEDMHPCVVLALGLLFSLMSMSASWAILFFCVLQALAVVTLGDKYMAQRIDNLEGADEYKRFYLQVFSPMCETKSRTCRWKCVSTWVWSLISFVIFSCKSFFDEIIGNLNVSPFLHHKNISSSDCAS